MNRKTIGLAMCGSFCTFARVLDASGAGLRIQTIHAFCQTLLAGFPAARRATTVEPMVAIRTE